MKYLIFLALFTHCFAQDFHDFDQYQKKLCRTYVVEKLEKYLIKDRGVEKYFAVGDEAIVFFDEKGNEEYRLEFAKKESLVKRKRRDLKGMKIAIDPGHLGGDFASFEERIVKVVSDDCEKGFREISFDEGTLALATGKHLKALLEKEGAIVMLTKERVGEGVLDTDFFGWLRNNCQYWRYPKGFAELFKEVYLPLDLHARARKINEFAPDLTVIIHYNAYEVPQGEVTDKNFNMVFLPGAFFSSELQSSDARYEFIRLLVTSDIEESEKLSSYIVNAMEKELKVPHVYDEEINYLKNCSLKIAPGVYARNLALTRLVHSPLCYGESLIQNNIKEVQILGKKDTVIDDIACPSRVKEVAVAYYKGIQHYVSGHE